MEKMPADPNASSTKDRLLIYKPSTEEQSVKQTKHLLRRLLFGRSSYFQKSSTVSFRNDIQKNEEDHRDFMGSIDKLR